MSDAEKNKVCKIKPVYEEIYNEGVLGENAQIADILKREGSFVEVVKHGNLGDYINAITVKIFFNAQ